MQERRIAIVGGGLAGLAAGYALAVGGAGVTLFEREPRLGGRAGTDELDGFRIDCGAQLFAGGYDGFLALVDEIGLGDSVLRVPGRDALWRGGRAHEVVYGSVASMIGSGGLPLRTKLRLGTTYVPFLAKHSASLDLHRPERAAAAGLDRESIAAWGEREIDSAFVRSLVYPQLGAYYGALPEETSAGFYHLLARLGMEVTLFGVAGGVGSVATRLASRIEDSGGTVRRAARVQGIRLDGTGVEVRLEGEAEEFDGVVAAVPAPILLDLLEGGGDQLRDWLSAVRYRPTLSLALLLESPTQVPYFGLSFPRGESRYVAAVSVQENKGVPLVPAGKGLLIAFATPEAAPELVTLESEAVLEAMLAEIARAFPDVEKRVNRARVYRWTPGSPVFFPGYLSHLEVFRSGRLGADLPIALAGDYLMAPSVEGAVTTGVNAARLLERRLG